MCFVMREHVFCYERTCVLHIWIFRNDCLVYACPRLFPQVYFAFPGNLEPCNPPLHFIQKLRKVGILFLDPPGGRSVRISGEAANRQTGGGGVMPGRPPNYDRFIIPISVISAGTGCLSRYTRCSWQEYQRPRHTLSPKS